MRILLLGGSGAVGRYLGSYLRGLGFHVISVDLVADTNGLQIDLLGKSAIADLISRHAPEAIVHLAAITDLIRCERDPDLSHLVNFSITERVTQVCRTRGIRLIYFSSDYVFGARDVLWCEQDTPCPTTQYGRDKAASEFLIRDRLTNFAIVRTAQLFGFPGDFVSLVHQTLGSNQVFLAFDNLTNCPTWIGALSPMIARLVSGSQQGTFHCVGPASLSRYDYALAIAGALELNSDLIQPESLDFSRDIRPPIVRLSGTATYRTLGVWPRRIQEELPACVDYLIKTVTT